MKQSVVTSWKTTVAGLAAGIPFLIEGILNAVAQGTFNGQGKYQILAGIGLIVFGAFSKDHDVTGNPPVKVNEANVTNPEASN